MAAAPALTEPPSIFYVYVHRRATDGSVFYVGKGKGDRAYRCGDRNEHWRRVVAKHGHRVEILRSGMTEAEALDYERDLIAAYGVRNLCNVALGGKGTAGYAHTEAARRAISEGNRGRLVSEDTRAKISARRTGQRLTEATKAKIIAKHIGQKRRPETCAKIAEANSRRVITAETRGKLRQEWTAERRARLAARNASAVVCVETGQRFATIQDAGAWLASFTEFKSWLKISCACRGKRKTAYGYRWRYAD